MARSKRSRLSLLHEARTPPRARHHEAPTPPRARRRTAVVLQRLRPEVVRSGNSNQCTLSIRLQGHATPIKTEPGRERTSSIARGAGADAHFRYLRCAVQKTQVAPRSTDERQSRSTASRPCSRIKPAARMLYKHTHASACLQPCDRTCVRT